MTTPLRPTFNLLAALVLGALLTGCEAPPPQSAQAQVGPGPNGAGPSAPPPNAAPKPRTLSVSGTAVIQTAPDEFVVSVGVDTFDPGVQVAKTNNDAIMAELLLVAKNHKLIERDIQTTNFRISPRYDNNYNRERKLVGYDVQKGLTLTLNSPETLEVVLTELFERGANRLDGIEMRSSKTVEKRREAREMAVDAALKKAEVMAAKLGQKIGLPLEVNEGAPQVSSWGNSMGNMNVNELVDNGTLAQIGETFASGKVQVSASVSVVFELTD